MEINQTKLLELAKKLIAFKSISPNQAGCLDYITTYLKDIGFKTIRLDHGKTSNLFAVIGSKKPIFAFAGHIDVVPSGDISKWDSDPFIMTETNNKLVARGISDMKGAVASFIIAAEQYINNKLNDYSIAILLTSDEESSAKDGTSVIVKYLKQQNIVIDYCLLGEPTSVDHLGDVIKNGRRGSLTANIEIIGKQGHIAYPELCLNPIHLFTNALHELVNTKWDNGNEFFPPTQMQFANLNSGLGVDNVIPRNLFANFNFRYNNLHTSDSLKKQVTKIFDNNKLDYVITWNDSAQPFLTKSGKLLTTVIDSIQETLQITPQLKTDGGTSDGRFLKDVCLELLEFGMVNASIHQINENIPKGDLLNLSKTYYNILNKFKP